MKLIDIRDQGAKALRAYEMQRDQRYPTPFESLSGDAKETSRRAFDRLSAAMALEGLTISLKAE